MDAVLHENNYSSIIKQANKTFEFIYSKRKLSKSKQWDKNYFFKVEIPQMLSKTIQFILYR